jgi:hypothetical protein
VNCRVNEEKVFPSPKVSELLQRHYIEARLHTDGDHNLERIHELQDQLGKSVATPLYVIQDPRSKRILGGPLGGITTVDSFQRVLRDAVDAREKVGRLDVR